MNCRRSAPNGVRAAGSLDRSESSDAPHAWRTRVSGLAGCTLVLLGLTACGEAAPDVTDTVTDACTEAREALAAAPTPADASSETAFVETAHEAAQAVATVIGDLGEQVEDQSLRDMAWQLNNFPQPAAEQELLGVAHEASAAIIRLDGFAEAIGVPECGAATWRPADWRAMADRLKQQQSEEAFHAQLNQLCAGAFPNPDRLAAGTPLLAALVNGGQDSSEDVVAELLSRLHRLDDRPAEAARFIREFNEQLPQMSPSENLEEDYLALVAAFLHVDSVVPKVIPDDPSAEFRRRVAPAFEELERAWGELDITCTA